MLKHITTNRPLGQAILSRSLFLTLTLALVFGCGEDPPVTPDAMSTDASVPPCEPALSLTPIDGTTPPYSGLQFEASGGTGSYHYEIIDNQSGASINEDSGAYIAGAAAGVTDVIEVTDLECSGRTSANALVVTGLTVAPRTVEMLPGTSFSFDVSGGSGNYECSFRSTQSGGQVTSGCSYTAGGTPGVDEVRIVDTGTGEYLESTLIVSTSATLRVQGGDRIFLPEGHRFQPKPVGGSGHLELTVMSGPISLAGSEMIGDAPGDGLVRMVDRYTSMELTSAVSVVAAFAPPVTRDGERSGDGVVHTVGDIDGDGYADGVMGFIELSVRAHYSGAVMVYAGGPSGLSANPVQVFGGTTRIETLGRDVEVADIDNDGELDLLIGADRSDQGTVNGGGVFIHKGVAGGFFEDNPDLILRGESSGDRFGHSVVACDFDDDGFLDLAVGSIEDEDRNVPFPADDQGAVHVFRGGAGGFGDRADFVLYGELPDNDGDYRGVTDMQFGFTVRAGDLDGDGKCDLAASAPESARSGTREDGAVLIYQGTTDDNLLLTRAPVRLYADVVGSDGNFGNSIEIADIDNDGDDDLAIGHYRGNLAATRGGAVYVYLSDSITDRDPGDPILPAEADWYHAGTGSYDYTGQDIAFGDMDGDAKADLIIGKSRAEDGSPINVGHIMVYNGADIESAIAADPGHDATDDAPAHRFVGVDSYGRLGQAVGGVGQGAVLALAGYDDTYGTESGAPYYMSTDAATPRLLQMPGESAGHEFGQGVTLYDVDKDGDRDLIVGGPGAAQGALGGNSGMVFYYDWSNGQPVEPAFELTNGHVEHDGSDRHGYAMSTAGDFNGDGIEDLAIIARGDERPDEFDPGDFANPNECPGDISLVGSVQIYLGQPSGLDDEPSFVAYGYGSSDYTRIVRGGFDYNDDGYDDVLISSYGWDDLTGGFSILYGQPASPGGALVLCDQERYMGVENYSYLGQSAAVLGDVDEDGCDDVAVGAPREDQGVFEQGIVRIMWGWGGPACPASPQVTTVNLTLPYTRLGTAIAGGGDIDGDGIKDLVVGGSNYRIDFSYVGGAWMIPGDYLLSLPRQTISVGVLPSPGATTLSPILPELGDLGRYGLVGPVAASLFGDAVALIPDPVVAGRSAVAIGVPRGNYGDVFLAGGVVIHRYVNNALGGMPGLDDIPYAIFAGETGNPEGLLGQVLEGHNIGGMPTLLVGAPLSDQRSLDSGSAYVLRFASP